MINTQSSASRLQCCKFGPIGHTKDNTCCWSTVEKDRNCNSRTAGKAWENAVHCTTCVVVLLESLLKFKQQNLVAIMNYLMI